MSVRNIYQYKKENKSFLLRTCSLAVRKYKYNIICNIFLPSCYTCSLPEEEMEE